MFFKKGFTLIELLAVVVIVAIIATIGIYSVTLIMNNARQNTLKDTAFSLKKAASLYLASTSETSYPITLNMTPADSSGEGAGDKANLIELGKDPWGKDYEEVYAEIDKINDKTVITIYIITKNNGGWYLPNDGTELLPLVFQAQGLNVNNPIEFEGQAIIKYKVPNLFSVDDLTVKVYKSFSPSVMATAGTDYTLVTPLSFSKDSGYYTVSLNMKSYGNMYATVTVKNGANVGLESDPVTLNVTAPPLAIANFNESNATSFKVVNTIGSTMTATVQCWTGSVWDNSVVNRPVVNNDTYYIDPPTKIIDVMYPPCLPWDHSTTSNASGLITEISKYKFKVILTDDTNSFIKEGIRENVASFYW